MKPSPLSPAAVRRSVSAVIEDLGRADRKRLEALFSVLQDDGRASLGLVLSTLFPALQREAALTAFRQFRGRFGAAATESGVALSLETDSQTRAAPDERWCWFVGDDGAAKAFEQRTDAETAGFSRVGQSGAELAETRDGKPLIRYFISYAGGERNLKTALMNKLKPFLELSTEYCFEAWDDGDIPLGENWHAEIQAAIARCQFGLLLTSPLYLTRDYVTAHELPAFVAPEAGAAEPGRRAIPVAIAPLLFDGSMDLKGLGERQIFRDSDGKSFNERRIDAAKEAFARELFQRIVKVVARHVAPNPPPAGHAARASSRIELAQRRHLDAAADWDCHVPTQGFKSSVDKIESEPEDHLAGPPPR